MARGDKNYDKVVRKEKGKSADKKKKAIHKMVEALIADESEEAASALHDYLQMKSREIVLGEMEKEEDEDNDEEKEEKDEKEEDEKEEDEKEKEEDEKEEDEKEEEDDDEEKEEEKSE